MAAADDLPVLRFADAAAFEAWMEAEHARAPGVWIEFAKKGTGIPTVVYAEALDVALCFGWIDGQARSVARRLAQFVEMLRRGETLR